MRRLGPGPGVAALALVLFVLGGVAEAVESADEALARAIDEEDLPALEQLVVGYLAATCHRLSDTDAGVLTVAGLTRLSRFGVVGAAPSASLGSCDPRPRNVDALPARVGGTLPLDIDLRARRGKTALMVAAKHGRADLVRRILRAGADVNARGDHGGTALMFAALGASPETLEVLLSAGAEVNAVGGFDWTALMIATVKGDSASVRRLLDHGAEVNRADIYGWTPLMRAALGKRAEVVGALLGSPGLILDARNDVGATALHLAAYGGSADIAEALVSHGSSTRAEDDEGRTPAEAAAQGGFPALAASLVSAGH